jgi:hypothetical protein
MALTPEIFENCAARGLRKSSVAALFGVSRSRISQLMQKPSFQEAWDRGAANLELRITDAQIAAAVERGDRTMLIWAGKTWAGQVDAPQTRHIDIDQRVSVRYVAEWGRDSQEIEAAANPMVLEAGDEDVWEEEE